MRSSGMPDATMVSIIGRRNSPFGTGRVMSQIRMQALCLAPGQLRQGGGADRAGRVRLRIAPRRVGQFRHRALADHRGPRAGRQGDRQLATPVGQCQS